MKAIETTVKSLFEGDKLYVVPRYQRRYAWDRQDWEQLWRAVERQYRAETAGKPGSHFIGSVVIAQRQSFPTEASNYDVIDGQQRLTTLMLLLAAIRDSIPEDETSRKRADKYVRNELESGEFLFKVRPGDADREALNLVLAGQASSTTGLMRSAYEFFIGKMRDINSESGTIDFVSMVRAATSRLEIVQILTGGADNAHRIFQTLNSTGKELTAVDLLRNHFFMLLPTHLDKAYSEHWAPLQDTVGDQFTSFLWVDLVTRPGLESVPNKADRIYSEWQTILDPLAGDEASVLTMLQELRDRGANYAAMRNANTGVAEIDARLSRLNEWRSAVHQPLTFAILERWRLRAVDTIRATTALEYVESFLVRRMLAGVPTNNLNRIFTTSVGQLNLPSYGSSDLDVATHRILSQPGKYWPSDEALIRDGLTSPFYERQQRPQRSFVLRRLEESYDGKYAPNWDACNFTIEHVMPQSPTQWWLDHLASGGETEPGQAHEDLKHTIGNLTLTCENPELGQMTFEQKCVVYLSDMMKMNDGIAHEQRWGRHEIIGRGRELLARAGAIWASPMPAEKQDDHALATGIRTVLEMLGRGRWVDQVTLSDYLDAEPSALDRALGILADDALAAIVLGPEGQLRPAVDKAGLREMALERLVEAGVIDSPSSMPAPAERRARAEDLDTPSGT